MVAVAAGRAELIAEAQALLEQWERSGDELAKRRLFRVLVRLGQGLIGHLRADAGSRTVAL